MKALFSRGAVARALSLAIMVTLILAIAAGCAGTGAKVKLDPKNPVTITVWHYYNGAILNAFESFVKEFNETVGVNQGIIVEIYGFGNVGELEKAVMASANEEIGSMNMPSVFASYADTAYEAEQLGLLANLGNYFTADEQAEYIASYIEEGKIGLQGELRIFPVAKSTEILMINETDWLPFAAECGVSYENLSSMAGIADVARQYYDWTDAKTPDVQNDGKSFFGRDAMANMFIIASKEFGVEIFEVENGVATINVDETVMRSIWDYYYVPYISGHYLSYGRYRSDDAKVGDILAYVGSTSSAAYFPAEVTAGGVSYPVKASILPVPSFDGGERVMVQQGAGMVVTTGAPEAEYASVVFLKWFTDVQKNSEFSLMSGYMPVKKQAMDYDALKSLGGAGLNPITDETLRVVIGQIATSSLYTNKAFRNGASARAVLEYHLQDKANADREAVIALIEGGMLREKAIAQFNTQQAFSEWVASFTQALKNAAG